VKANSFKVISVGDLVTDIVISIPNLPVNAAENQIVDKIQFEPGGAGNFLIAGARLDLSMQSLGVVGNDNFSAAIHDILKSEGVDISSVIKQQDGTTTTVFVLVDNDGQHVFLGQYGEGPELTLSNDWKSALQLADAVQFWGYTLREKRLLPSFLEAMQFTYNQNRTVFFDPGPYMEAATKDQLKFVLSNSHILLLTDEELPHMCCGKTGQLAVEYLLSSSIKMVCVKHGPKGCSIYTNNEQSHHPGFPVTARDTTAAGDSFAAAFIYAYLQKWPLSQISEFSNAMGAAKVEKFGSGRQVPTAADIFQILSRFNSTLISEFTQDTRN
jgi:ribokinase